MSVSTFIWDELSDNVLIETDELGAITAAYTSEPGRHGAPISQVRSGSSSYFHYDANGSTRTITDSNQNVTDTATYSGYGETIAETGSTSYPFRYKGKAGFYSDEETGEINVRVRTYKPPIGRWLSLDPLGFVDGINLYFSRFVPSGEDPTGTRAAPAQAGIMCPACLVQLRCFDVLYHFDILSGIDVYLGNHCGLTVQGYGELDGFPSNFPNPTGVIIIREPTDREIDEHAERTYILWEEWLPDSVCRCLMQYKSIFNAGSSNIPYLPFNCNSNWALKCMITQCNVPVPWSATVPKPSFYDYCYGINSDWWNLDIPCPGVRLGAL